MRPIDADALMNELRSMVKYENDGAVDCGSYNAAIIDAKAAISSAPTISPDDVRGVGEWITKENGKVWWYECSCCGTRPLKSRWANEETLSCYCPSCGAWMKGVSEDANN